MNSVLKVIGPVSIEDTLGPALKEAGFDFSTFNTLSEISQKKADCYVFDWRDPQFHQALKQLRSQLKAPILSLVAHSMQKDDLIELKKLGMDGYISDKIPPEEFAVRIQALLKDGDAHSNAESRSSNRVWFQQEVEFTIFNQTHKAWSTTLSQTGLFLRTSLSFPLYSVVQLKFDLLGEKKPFTCQAVIVRQEVEAEIRGIGLMFQNLSGEQIRSLESFLEISK